MLKIISFDMNGTLTQDMFIELVWKKGIPDLYSQKEKIPFEQAKEHVFREYEKVGEERKEWYDIKYWFNFFGLGKNWRGLLQSFGHEIKPFPEVPLVLERLSQVHKLIVTTNAAAEFFNIELETAGLKGYFAGIFSSTSDFGEVKKTPEVYLKVCQALGIKPEEMVHIGDHRLFDFVVPRELGIRAFYLDRKGREHGDFVVENLTEFWEKLKSWEK